MKGLTLGICAGACALAVVGCGNGGGSQSKADVVAKANALCKEFDRLETKTGEPPKTVDGLIHSLSQLEPGAQRLVAQLAALDPPSADREPFDRFVEISKEQVETIGEMQDALTTGDGARVQAALTKLDTSEVRANIAAQQYGINDCVDKEWTDAP